MTVSELNDRIVRILAAALGVGLVLAVVWMARPAGGHGGVLPASLRVLASQDGAVAVYPTPPKPVLANAHLRPGGHAAGSLRLRNQTGERLAVGLRAKPSSTALDGLARVRVLAAGRMIFDSTLEALREGTSGRVRLAPGGVATIRVLAWIPAREQTGYEGRRVDVQLEPFEGSAR